MQIQTADVDIEQVVDDYLASLKTPETPEVPGTSGTSDSCPHKHYYESEGTYICSQCKAIVTLEIDEGPEWRTFKDGVNHSRCGHTINYLLLRSSYGTTMSHISHHKTLFQRLKQINSWNSAPYAERSRKLVFDQINEHGRLWGLTNNILSYSCYLYSEFNNIQLESQDSKLSRGNNRRGVMAACLYYACKKFNVTRQPEEIAKICQLDVTSVNKGIKLFYNVTKHGQLIDFDQDLQQRSLKHLDLFERYCLGLKIPYKYRQALVKLFTKIAQLHILSKNTPKSMISATIYYGCVVLGLDHSYTKATIANHCHVSSLTLSRAYNKLISHNANILNDIASQL